MTIRIEENNYYMFALLNYVCEVVYAKVQLLNGIIHWE
jgi:hypothetical protein